MHVCACVYPMSRVQQDAVTDVNSYASFCSLFLLICRSHKQSSFVCQASKVASHDLLLPFPPQAIVENLLKEYPNVLTLRVRMPIVADLVYPRNFITKIIKYDKVSGLAA